ncbi:excisionase family DNA binding protein [Planotetraspora sp. GP83]
MSALKEVKFLTVAEIAKFMRVSKMTVYRLIHAGELSAIRVGRVFRVHEQEVIDYLKANPAIDTAMIDALAALPDGSPAAISTPLRPNDQPGEAGEGTRQAHPHAAGYVSPGGGIRDLRASTSG